MKSFLYIPVLLLVLLCGCRTVPYTPPQRPTAGMFPTLLPGSELSRFTPVAITEAELESHLRELSFWEPLTASNLQQTELALVVRSLARRGYAELDARRCDCPVHWVVFMGYPAHALTIVGETSDGSTPRKSWSVTPSDTTP